MSDRASPQLVPERARSVLIARGCGDGWRKVARLPQSALTVLTSTGLGSPFCHYTLGYLYSLTGFPGSLGDTERSTGHGHMYCRPSLAYRCPTGARLVPRHLPELRRRKGFPGTGPPVQIHYDQEANPPANPVPDATGWLTALVRAVCRRCMGLSESLRPARNECMDMWCNVGLTEILRPQSYQDCFDKGWTRAVTPESHSVVQGSFCSLYPRSG